MAKQQKKLQQHHCPLCKKDWYSYSRHHEPSRVCSWCSRRQRRWDAAEQEHAAYRFLKDTKQLMNQLG